MTNSAFIRSTLQFAHKTNPLSPALHNRYTHAPAQAPSFSPLPFTLFYYNKRLRVEAAAENQKKRNWWHKFFLQQVDDFNGSSSWFGLDDQSAADGHMEDANEENDDEKEDAWKRRVEAVSELRDFQEQGRKRDFASTDWEDWLDESWSGKGKGKGNGNGRGNEGDDDWEETGGVPRDKTAMPERGMYRNIKELFFGVFENPSQFEEDVTSEDRVFQYTTQVTAKFVALLVLVPWAVGFVFHDYVMVPFLNRYVELVPFAAQVLDVRKDQKLLMLEDLKREKLRFHFEAEIRMAPPPSEEELWEHMRHKARELREEMRLENRKLFANIWSDMAAVVAGFLILFFNQSKLEIMKFTGSRILKGISETGKAFLLILASDIFLGYHSESGWHTLIEMLLEHYGLMADDGAITVFICTVPVTMDVCFKLWVFKYLPRFSPSTAATFHEMKRH